MKQQFKILLPLICIVVLCFYGVVEFRRKNQEIKPEVFSDQFIKDIEDRQRGTNEVAAGQRSRVITKEDVSQEIGEDLLETYWRYMTSIRGKCDSKIRLGPKGDTGYIICEDSNFKPAAPCLVYSFGSRFLFGFEQDIIRRYQCEVHTFDPSHPIAGHTIPSGVQFHLIGLSSRDFTNADGWKMQNLTSIRRDLGHSERVLDILKIDVEGSEWLALPEIINSGTFRYVKQLLVEFHFGLKLNPATGFKTFLTSNYYHVSTTDELAVIKRLYDDTVFRSFLLEANDVSLIKFKEPYGSIATCNVISFVNTMYQK